MFFFLIASALTRTHRRCTRVDTLARKRRASRAALEPLERRLALTGVAFTWSGADGVDGGHTWSDSGNWENGRVPLLPGSAVTFPPLGSLTVNGQQYPQNTTIYVDNVDDADVSMLTVNGSYSFEADPIAPSGPLTLDANSSIVIAPGASVTFVEGLDLKLPGSTTVSFSGDSPSSTGLDVQAQPFVGPTPNALRPIKIGGSGTLTLGSTTTLLGSNIIVGPGSTASVGSQAAPQIGTLSGSSTGAGTVEMNGSSTDGTQLSINPQPDTSAEFDGAIEGSGGILSLDDGNGSVGQNAGTQIIGSINPYNTGDFQLQVNSGTLQVNQTLNSGQVSVADRASLVANGPFKAQEMALADGATMQVNDTVDAKQVTVASGATFGGPATMTFTGDGSASAPDVVLNSGATFAAELDGTASGDFTQLTDTDRDTSDGQSTVQLGGSILAVTLGSSYVPRIGDPFTIISTTKGTIQGSFANAAPNAANNATVTIDGVGFLVSYSQDSVMLTVVSQPSTTSISVPTPAPTYGQSVAFSANVAPLNSGLATPTGTIQFEVNGMDLGKPVTLVRGSATSMATANVPAGADTITAIYSGDSTFAATATAVPLSVNKATLTVTADKKSKIYGAADPALSYTVTGLLNNDPPSVVSGVTFSTATGAAATVGTHAITATGGSAANYAITDANGTLTVSQAGPLTVTANNESKVYGGADPTPTYTVSGTFYYNDGPGVVSGVTLSTATGAAATAGTHVITATGGAAANYVVTDASGTLTVSQAATLTVTADNENKVYGAADPSLIGAYSVNGTFYYGDGPGVVSGVSLSTVTGAAATAGTHAITATGGTAANYIVANASGTLTVSQAAALTVTANNASKVYGAADPALTYTVTGTFYYGDGPSVVSGVSLLTAIGAAATAGTHVITATDGTAANYAISDASGTLTVSPAAALTVTANNESKVYGAADPTLTYSVLGVFFYGDGSSVVTGMKLSTATGAAATAGTHVISATGGTAANYMISDANGTLTVSRAAALTVTPDPASKVYGAADPTLTYTVTGTFYYGDGPSVVSGVTLSTAIGAAATAGTHTITATGGTAANYAITYDSGTLAVSRAPLSIMADNEPKTYGQVFIFTGTDFTTSTLYYNDTVTSATLTSAGAAANAAVPGSPYPISASNGAGNGLANYLITYAAGSMAVNPLGITVSGITADDKGYDGSAIASINTGGAALVGVLAGDVVNLYTGAAQGTFSDKNVGDDKTVTIAGLSISGPDASNYFLMQTTATANITARAISASITAADKSYDGTTDATITGRTFVGVLFPDSVTLVAGTATFTDKNVGNDKLVTATGLSLTGADAGNYTVNPTAMTTANITTAELSVTGLAVDGKVYDGTTSATLNTSSAGLSGVKSGDQVKLVTAGATGFFGDKNVGNSKPVTVSGLSLSGADARNYTLVAPLGLTAGVTPARLLVTATNQGMTYGGTVPILTYTTSGLVQGDTSGSALTGGLALAGPVSAALSYSITQGTLSAINYAITFKGAELTVAPAPTTIILPMPVRVSVGGRRVYEVVATVSTTVPGLIPTGSVLVQQGRRKTRVPVGSNGTAILAKSGTRPVGQRYTVTFLPNNGNYTQSKPTSKTV